MEDQNQGSKRKYTPKEVSKRTKKLFSNNFTIITVVACTFLVVYFLAITNVTPQKYSVVVGSVAYETIDATKDITDTFTTNENKKIASESVGIKYTQNDTVQPTYVNSETAFFDALISLKTKEYELIKARAEQAGNSVTNITDYNLSSALTDADYNTLKSYVGVEMSKDEMKNALSMSDVDINKLRAYLKEQTSLAYTSGIKQDAISAQIETILSGTKEKSSALYNKLPNTLKSFLAAYLKPNIVQDAEATAKAKTEAEDAVIPTTYQKGQTIVRRGDIVTEAQYSVLTELGLINNSSIDLSIYVGAGCFIALLLALLAYYISHYEKKLLEQKSSILIMGIIICVSILVTFILSKLDSRLNIIYFGTLLCAVVFNVRLAAMVNVFLALVVTMVIKDNSGTQSMQIVYNAISCLIGGMAGLLYTKRSNRSSYLKSGAVAGIVAAFANASILAVTNNDMMTLITTSGFMIISAFISAVLLIGSLPIFESVFNVLTDSKLLELSDPKNALLKKLAMEAPGTYHHSMLVANLAENAAEAVGANGLLARVGSYYHDIGKLRRPLYFSENQQGNNPHDNLEPKVSASIILSHPKDGLRFANQYKLPKEICDIIEQHHGTTIAAYFFEQAKCSGNETDIEDYRYDGSKPIAKEAAIVMLADTIEAAIRAMISKTDVELKEKIDKLVNMKMREGQLNECNLTFHELSIIKRTFFDSYKGITHTRIAYPELKWPDEESIDGSII